MRMVGWEFSPGLWPTLCVLLIFPLFIFLGFWQLDRAEQKQLLDNEFENRQSAEVVDLNKEDGRRNDFEDLHWRNVVIRGTFFANANILLDNRVKGGAAGYFVYTPFKLVEENVSVLVNRGWIPVGESRAQPPQIGINEKVINIAGSIKSVPRTGVLLAENTLEQFGGGITRVQSLGLIDIEALLGLKFLPYIVRLNPESPGGFVREWKAPGFGEEKHFGYAFQWFAMAAVILFIYLILNINRV